MKPDASRQPTLGPGGGRRLKVSIGLPVYNGETYLRGLLDSVLAQTFGEFELIISDNASTDATETICREYEAADARIHYHRQARNHGVTWNFRQVVLLSSGTYFLWTSHDDLMAPKYVERCVEVLDKDPSVVLCHSSSIYLDDAGNQFEPKTQFVFDQPEPHQRFRRLMSMSHNCMVLYGLIRMDVLRKTSIQADFADGDRCALAELGLHGRYHRIAEPLFFHREHASRFTHQHPSRQARTRLANPDRPMRLVFPVFRVLKEGVLAVHRAPLGRMERFRCYLELVNWVRRYIGLLCSDLKFAFIDLTSSGSRLGASKPLEPDAARTDSVSH